MNREEKIKFWLKNANDELVEQMKKMSATDLEESFTYDLTFGTAGIRGIIGPGTSRMNIYNVIKPTYGYAKFLQEKYKQKEILVVIGTDNRHKKEEFSTAAAEVLSSHGIKVVKSLIVPTPLVSFAIRSLKAQGGIIITASHNPADNNGYKVYDETGAQLLPHDADKVLEYSEEKTEYLTYKYQKNESLISRIPQKVFDEYEKHILKIGYKPHAKKKIKIIFSPQHGTSAKFIPKYLRKLGYEVIEVAEQMSHDPDFGGTIVPNPEQPEAYELGINYAQKHDADLFITVDPDADRVGVAAKKDGIWTIQNGNQTASLILAYILENEKLDRSFIVYSYVSTHLAKLMANKHGVESFEVATGFKWIGDLIDKFTDKNFLFGFEESFGSLINQEVARDKDSLQSAIILAEIANNAKTEGRNIWNLLEDIYQEYGYFDETTTTKSFDGINGIQERVQFMDNLRLNAKTMFADEYEVIDLIKGKDYVAPMNLIKFAFKSGSWIATRPSGTEAKIKFYKIAVGKTKSELKKENLKISSYLRKIMEQK